MNENTNGLLLIIIAILLFGSGAVLGFFSTLFWIIVVIIIIAVLVYSVTDIVKRQKEAYEKHPVINIIFGILFVVFFLWLIIAWKNQSSSKNTINTQFQPQYAPNIPTTQPEVKQHKLNVEKARQIINPETGLKYSDEDIQAYLQSHPDVYVYPEVNRNAFLTSCYKTSENNITGCTCLLNYFQARYTLDEFAQIEAEYVQTKKSEAIMSAAQYCAK